MSWGVLDVSTSVYSATGAGVSLLLAFKVRTKTHTCSIQPGSDIHLPQLHRLEILAFLKGLNVNFAKFVLCIPVIVRDMSSFIIVMGFIVVGFTHSYSQLEVESDPDHFGTFGDAFLTVYQLMLGEFAELELDTLPLQGLFFG